MVWVGLPALKEPHLDWELELFVQLCYEHVVAECLPHLHDAHNGCVNLILAVLEDALRRTRILLLL